MTLPAELSFIDDILEPSESKYRRADWLLSNFADSVWKYSFNFKQPKELNWDVAIDNGTSLIDPANSDLLNSFKYWLVVSTRAGSGGGAKINALVGQVNLFNRGIHLIDYFLINASKYGLSKYGLGGLSADDIKYILDLLVSFPDSAESVYDWSNKLCNFLHNAIDQTDPVAIEDTLDKYPELSSITPEQEDEYNLSLPLSLIPAARAYLKLNNFYVISIRHGRTPNSKKLSELIYSNSLKGKHCDKPSILALSYTDTTVDYMRELPAVPVTVSDKSRMGQGSFSIYRKIFYNIGVLHEIGLPAPEIDDLKSIYDYEADASAFGRYRTIPSGVVFSSVRKAIEFHLEHGKELINSFGKLCIACKRLNKKTTQLSDNEFSSALTKHIRNLGVKSIGFSTNKLGVLQNSSIKGNKDDYFSKLRNNDGFLELLSVYYGAVEIVVGALMARRVGELIDLHADTCLDFSEKYLCFENRKSTRGVMGLRNLEARPIEPVAVDMIKNIRRLQIWMRRLGYIDSHVNLFSMPSLKGSLTLSQISKYNYNKNIDFFCDYFNVDTNHDGQRYYIRQHQLRRFFALLFFYSSSFGGLETLQWMLGHTDQTHVWHYITESIEGTVLRGAKAQFVAESLHRYGVQNFNDLAELLKEKFGTDDFSIVDTEELEDYLEDLLKDGQITIEPEFLEIDDKQRMRVIVKVTELNDDYL